MMQPPKSIRLNFQLHPSDSVYLENPQEELELAKSFFAKAFPAFRNFISSSSEDQKERHYKIFNQALENLPNDEEILWVPVSCTRASKGALEIYSFEELVERTNRLRLVSLSPGEPWDLQDEKTVDFMKSFANRRYYKRLPETLSIFVALVSFQYAAKAFMELTEYRNRD